MASTCTSTVAVMNYTEREVLYTLVIEHKHFEFGTQPVTYVTKEYLADWQPGEETYYPVNNECNQKLYQQYAELASKEENVIFGGRLAEYKYFGKSIYEKNLTSTGQVQIFVVMPNLQCVVLLHVEIRECYWLLRSYSMLLHVQLSAYQVGL